ncbi:hypothetical protein DSCOOX_22120 [Desulfosarcina ovata subsp. ovata]|uniref:Uncharacterized protein n=1 Tax=Desulfosarcina ovata subsp. ovata TaxID=2752305 RepID=A0A5K8A8R5_9BACT|nr:hypothetical protein DSCOOX_22120 [Desulfosarcina ovata subsp. ovata]
MGTLEVRILKKARCAHFMGSLKAYVQNIHSERHVDAKDYLLIYIFNQYCSAQSLIRVLSNNFGDIHIKYF